MPNFDEDKKTSTLKDSNSEMTGVHLDPDTLAELKRDPEVEKLAAKIMDRSTSNEEATQGLATLTYKYHKDMPNDLQPALAEKARTLVDDMRKNQDLDQPNPSNQQKQVDNQGMKALNMAAAREAIIDWICILKVNKMRRQALSNTSLSKDQKNHINDDANRVIKNLRAAPNTSYRQVKKHFSEEVGHELSNKRNKSKKNNPLPPLP